MDDRAARWYDCPHGNCPLASHSCCRDDSLGPRRHVLRWVCWPSRHCSPQRRRRPVGQCQPRHPHRHDRGPGDRSSRAHPHRSHRGSRVRGRASGDHRVRAGGARRAGPPPRAARAAAPARERGAHDAARCSDARHAARRRSGASGNRAAGTRGAGAAHRGGPLLLRGVPCSAGRRGQHGCARRSRHHCGVRVVGGHLATRWQPPVLRSLCGGDHAGAARKVDGGPCEARDRRSLARAQGPRARTCPGGARWPGRRRTRGHRGPRRDRDRTSRRGRAGGRHHRGRVESRRREHDDRRVASGRSRRRRTGRGRHSQRRRSAAGRGHRRGGEGSAGAHRAHGRGRTSDPRPRAGPRRSGLCRLRASRDGHRTHHAARMVVSRRSTRHGDRECRERPGDCMSVRAGAGHPRRAGGRDRGGGARGDPHPRRGGPPSR